MLKDKLTLVINSCQSFSDLWPAHMWFLDQYWPKRGMATLLVTDDFTDQHFDAVQTVCTGSGKEYPQRMKEALPKITTEYVLLTLDDYFLVNSVNEEKLERLIGIMDRENIDYIRLFPEPISHKKYKDYPNLYQIDLNTSYAVNLYQGIWRRSFIESTLGGIQNIWQYEVSLTETARKTNARCVMSTGSEFETLDVIRKGKILHKAYRYLAKEGIYLPERRVISYFEEMRIAVFSIGKKVLPKKAAEGVKSVLRMCGVSFFSDSF